MNRKGSASILVIMVSLTLMIFGVFSMMNAYAGLAVARRHGEWNEINHQLESRAALVAAGIHKLVEETVRDIGPVTEASDVTVFSEEVVARVQRGIEEEGWPVVATIIDLIPGSSAFQLSAQIHLEPLAEERAGFMGEVIFRIPLGKTMSSPEVTIIEWKAVAESFEYIEGLEFKDVEVE